MLKISLIGKTQDFFDHYKEQIESKSINNTLTVVTPNPAMADMVRMRFDSVSSSVDVITISKFMQGELNSLVSETVLENYKGKSEIILLLGAIWKKIGKADDYVSFKRAFNLLTEFRSFSISDQVLETVLENYDEELAQGVLWLHRFLGELELVDEHKSYFMLSERLREGDLPPEYVTDRSIIFYGFDFLTASQVDMLKSFALRDDIIIPFYKEVFDKSSNFDWINWFDEHNLETQSLGEVSVIQSENEIQKFPKNYVGKFIKGIELEDIGTSLVIASKTITREQYQEIPIGNLKCKVSVDLFTDDHKKISNILEELVSSEAIGTNEVRARLKEEINTLIDLNQYRAIKSCLLYLQKINEWEELSDENFEVGLFDFHIIKESVSLDLPRVNLANLNTQKLLNLRSLSEIENIKNEKVTFVLNSNHGGIRGVGSNYSENVEKYLTSIGPIRRAELDIDILKAKFKEFVIDNQVSFLVEDGLIEHDSSISDLFSQLSLVEINNKVAFSSKKEYLQTQTKVSDLSKISASKLQKYMECPKKYYFQYISKTSPMVDFESELSVLDLGQIQHKVIEEYFKIKNTLDEGYLDELIVKTLDKFLEKKAIIDIDEYLVEIKAYTLNAIKSLLELKEKYNLNYSFELDFKEKRNDLSYNGSIDLFATNDDVDIIIDFKRSNRTFTSFKSILDFEQVQLWFYVKRLMRLKKIRGNKKLCIGYIDLSNIENSMFFINEKDFAGNFKKETSFGKIKVLEDFDEILEEYSEFEDELLAKLMADSDFNPKPLNKNSCVYCTLKNICPREVI